MATVQDNAVVGAHLCGSVPLPTADDVFRVVGEELGGHLRRIPDGETSDRFMWIGWYAQIFWQIDGLVERHPFYEEYSPRVIGLADGRLPEDIRYPSLGYVDAALASYETFKRYEQEGKLPADVRFQVSMGTPIATVSAAVAPSERRPPERGGAEDTPRPLLRTHAEVAAAVR